MKFGIRLRKLRIEKGISLKKLAPELKLDYTYISKLENSKVLPSAEVIIKLAEYFGYDPDELLVSVGKLPPDIEKIFQERPKEAINILRKTFAPNQS
jgi:transcriptional regulator with XRE-family HTH domain